MAQLRKGDTVSNTQEISLSNSIVLSPDSGFYCTRGGKVPKLAFVHPLTREVVTITDRDGRLAPMMTPIAPDQLPADLQAFFDLDAPPVPAFRKGDILALGAPIEALADGQSVHIPAGTRVKVVRGGKSLKVMLRVPGSDMFRTLKLGAKDAAALVASSPVPDNPSLSRITVDVQTFLSKSDETVAVDGIVTLDGKRLAVHCDGRGDALRCQDIDAGTYKRLTQLLVEVLADANVSENPDESLIDSYLIFVDDNTFGMETFADFMRDK